MESIVKNTKLFISENKLFDKNAKILLAVSGGVDSIVMLDIFKKLKISFAIAHCNFQLRGKDSDDDQNFVKKIAYNYDVEFYTINFETEKYAKDKGISTQMAARDLRYFWFEKTRFENNFDFIAVAHNKNDLAETILLNLTRGTGLKGLTGIKVKLNKIIRPLLFASRDEIEKYQKKNNLKFREDSSNAKTKYKRNKIRHQVIPILQELNPSFFDTMFENSHRFNDAFEIYRTAINLVKNNIISEKGKSIFINIKELIKTNSVKTYLFEYLKPYNFSDSQLNDILNSIKSTSGKQFISPSHKLIKDREFFIISRLSEELDKDFFICKIDKEINEPIKIKLSILDVDAKYKLSKNKNVADIDIDILNFPLKLRKWKKGDYFMPLGMKRAKKLSDFFIDEKIPLSEKQNIWILESKGEIVWILGLRLDDRYKITKDTKQVFRVEF